MSKSQIATGGIADDAVTSAKTELGLITMVDQFRLTADVTGTNADITSNLERIDTPTTPLIGSGVTNSSGIFSFPSTGIYLIIVNAMFSNPNTTSSIDGQCGVLTKVTIDNSYSIQKEQEHLVDLMEQQMTGLVLEQVHYF